MSAVGRFTVRLSAAVLPTEIRDRYREQWLGELRDAPQHGIRPSAIAIGSVSFAATYARPAFAGRSMATEAIARRSRWAIALSLSAAILAIAQYANIVDRGRMVRTDDASVALSLMLSLVSAYMLIAPTFAIILVLITSAMRARVRLVVTLFVLATAVTALRSWIDAQILSLFHYVYFSTGTIVYGIALVLVAVASVLVWRAYKPPTSGLLGADRVRRLIESVVGGLVVAISVVVARSDAARFWESRAPLEFGLDFSEVNRAAFENWVTLKVQFETNVSFVFALWLVIGLAMAICVAVSGGTRYANGRRTLLVTIAALVLTTLSYAAFMSFLQFSSPTTSPTVPLDVVWLVAQFGIIVVVAALVRQELTPRPRASQARLDEDEFRNVETRAPAR